MADILIRGMGMPKHCFNCSTKIDPDNRQCNIDGHVFEETLSKLTCRRDENCPLVELPEHVDLISLEDALIDADERAYDFWTSDDEANGTKQFLMAQPVIVPSNKEETE